MVTSLSKITPILYLTHPSRMGIMHKAAMGRHLAGAGAGRRQPSFEKVKILSNLEETKPGTGYRFIVRGCDCGKLLHGTT